MKSSSFMRIFTCTLVFLTAFLLMPDRALSQSQSDRFLPFFFPGIEACNGELVDIEGYFHETFTIKEDGNGGFHLRYHVNAQGEGIGQTTGTTYLWRDVINESFNVKKGQTDTYGQSLKLIAKGGAASGHLIVTFHITITPDGVVTSFVDSVRLQCQ